VKDSEAWCNILFCYLRETKSCCQNVVESVKSTEDKCQTPCCPDFCALHPAGSLKKVPINTSIFPSIPGRYSRISSINSMLVFRGVMLVSSALDFPIWLALKGLSRWSRHHLGFPRVPRPRKATQTKARYVTKNRGKRPWTLNSSVPFNWRSHDVFFCKI